MKYKLVDILPPYVPGRCTGCVFFTSTRYCKKPINITQCISYKDDDYHHPQYKHYHMVQDSINKQTKVL